MTIATPDVPDDLPRGISLIALNRILCRLGGRVCWVRRTGELRYSHPMLPHTARANGRCKDAPAHLVVYVRKAVVAVNKAA